MESNGRGFAQSDYTCAVAGVLNWGSRPRLRRRERQCGAPRAGNGRRCRLNFVCRVFSRFSPRPDELVASASCVSLRRKLPPKSANTSAKASSKSKKHESSKTKLTAPRRPPRTAAAPQPLTPPPRAGRDCPQIPRTPPRTRRKCNRSEQKPPPWIHRPVAIATERIRCRS